MPYKDPNVRREYARKQMQRRRDAAKADAVAATTEAVEAKRVRDPIACAMAGGLFEGEGTATISMHGRPGYSRCVVSLTSTDHEIVTWLNDRWPGSITDYPPRRAAHRPHWTWRLNGDAVLPFLMDIDPYLVTARKREVVRLVVACQQARWEGRRRDGYLDKIGEFHQRVKILNRRGSGRE